VIKVEQPGTGDDTRAFPPFVAGQSAYFATLNAGKQSIALDLKAEGDRAIFERLVARADVLVENFRPGVMDRLGYGWETLRTRHPRLVYAAVSGFGQTGPDAGKPAYDMVVQARGGVMSITGEAGGPPVRVGASIGDIVAGMFLTQGILAALYDRERTGKGAMVDVAMLDSQLAIMEHAIAITGATGVPPGPTGARHPTITPFATFRAADGFVVIAAGNDALFVRLCDVLGMPLAGDARFATNAARCANHALLKRLIEAVTLGETVAHWVATLDAAGLPTGRVQDMTQVLRDPQLLARHMVQQVAPRGDGPGFVAAGNPVKLSTLAELARGATLPPDDALVIFTPSGKRGRFALGTPVLTAARQLGVDLDSVCGGRGICSKCQITPGYGEFSKHGVTVADDALSDWNAVEDRYKRIRGLIDGRRLGCQAKVMGDVVIDVPPESQVHKQVIRKSATERVMQMDPATRAVYVEVEEPDMHEPTGDLERLARALFAQWQVEAITADLGVLRRLQPVLRKGEWKVTVVLHKGNHDAVTRVLDIFPGFHEGPLYGLAVDLGSTTIAAHLCDLSDGRVLASSGLMNPQIRFGEDLMSRVSYAMMNPGGDVEMTRAVREAINALAVLHRGRGRGGAIRDLRDGDCLQPCDAPPVPWGRSGGTGPGPLCPCHVEQPVHRCARG
jgi:CoA:oxalate CoA-transferase